MWGWKARMARATASTDGMAESSANGLRDFWSLRFDFSFFFNATAELYLYLVS